MQRYFVSKIDNNFILSDSDYHHVKDVMRVKNHEHIICVYENKSFLCFFDYTNNGYQISIDKEISKDVELPKNVILYQATIKNDKFDFVIQKATELGVSDIYPTVFSRSVVKVEKDKEIGKLIRYEKIMKEACEQSHRQMIPEIHPYIPVKSIVLDDDTLGLFAYENNGEYGSLHEVLMTMKDYKKVAIIVGPEGGFDPSEVKYLLDHNFKSISLGKRILRSETASLYALSVVGHYLEGM